ncbi:unnamed protein product [Brassica oleracea]
MVRVNLWDARRWQRKFESKQGPNPLFYQCTFKPNRIIYRTYKYHFFTFSQLSKTLAPFLSRGDFEGDYFLTFLTTGNLAYSVVLTADLKLRLVELRRRPENGFTITPAADLFTALRRALNADKYEELKESKLGVFIKFKELNFGWALRLVHYMLSFQLNIKKKVEVTKEMAAFWEMMGVDVDDGPTTKHIKAAFGRCEEWSREDRMRLGYLAIFTGFIEGRKYSTATWASLARLVWAYFALPEFGANFGHPLPDRPSPLLLAYNGGRERIFFKEAISKQTSVINFVHKDYAEMFPRWDFDVEDPAAENIIKVMFNAKANWKWTMDCWEVTGTNPRVKKEVSAAEIESGVKEESARPRKKARKEAFVEASKVPSAGFSKSDASTSVGGMTKEQIEKSFKDIADVMRDGFGMCLKEIKLLGDRIEAVEKKVGITKKGTASNELQITTSNPEKRGHEPGSESVNGAKAGKNDAQEPSSSKDLSLWSHHYPEFKSDEGDINGLGRRLPGGAWNYHVGIVPSFCQSMKVWGLDVDDIYAPRHIVVWDSILTHISAADLDVLMEPFVNMVPYLFVECAGSDEERVKHTLEPYTYERVTVGVPQCRAGDCGVFAGSTSNVMLLGGHFLQRFVTRT